MTKDNIVKILKDNKQLLSKYNIKKIGLFGSFVRKEQKENSDVDFLVEFISPVSILKHVNLIFELEQLLGLKVDVVTPNPNESEKKFKNKIMLRYQEVSTLRLFIKFFCSVGTSSCRKIFCHSWSKYFC